MYLLALKYGKIMIMKKIPYDASDAQVSLGLFQTPNM